MIDAFRLATADPYVNAVGRRQALVARVGYGAGEEVADGHWTNARELPPESPRRCLIQQQPDVTRVASGTE